MSKPKIYCEITCGFCGGLAYMSGYYKDSSTISELRRTTKNWIWDEEHGTNLCPDCQEKLKRGELHNG